MLGRFCFEVIDILFLVGKDQIYSNERGRNWNFMSKPRKRFYYINKE